MSWRSLLAAAVLPAILAACAGNSGPAIQAAIQPLVFSAPTVPDATVGTTYSLSLNASGGTAPYTWTLINGSLPAGISITAAGVVSGAPTTTGSSSFTVQVQDSSATPQRASASATMKVLPPAIAITTTTFADGTVGAAYSGSLSASGGTAPYSWSIASGALPNGLSLSSTGNVTGVPNAAGVSTFTVLVRDSSNPSVTQTSTFNLLIRTPPPPALNVTTTSLVPGTAGQPYSAALTASGGQGSYSWSLAAGSLPPGLTLNPAGTIAGTPTATGSSSFTVRVADGAIPANVATRALTLTIAGTTLAVATSSLPSVTVDGNYAVTLIGTGGIQPYSWTLVSGALPAGLSLNANGNISGVANTATVANFTVQLRDSSTPANTVTKALSIAVNALPLVINTSAFSSGPVNVAYSATLSASGGTTPYTWTLKSGALPAGLVLSTAGIISGTPTTPGSSSFTLQVADAGSPQQVLTRAYTLTINPSALTISTTSLPDGVTGAAYSQQLVAAGGTLPYTWSLQSGTLPAGLSFNASGLLSGTPTTAGSTTLTFKVVDSAGTPLSASAPLTLRVDPPALTITTTGLAAGTYGVAYNTSLAASGGVAPYSWSVVGGSLPAGISLGTDGSLTGTPTAVGTSTFTVQLADAQTPTATTTRSFTLTVNPAALRITTSTLASGQVGIAYSQGLDAAGGTAPYTWTVSSGSLPAGLFLSSSGTISGTPTTAGNSSFIVRVTDAQEPASSTTVALSLTIAPPPLVVVTATLPNGTVGSAYSDTLAASGGVSPYSWTVTSGALPAGLSLSAAGTISGTPTAVGTASFTVQARDAQAPAAVASKSLTITTVAAPLTIATSALPSAAVNVAYSANLAAAGGVTPYTWSIASGSLPAGLSLSTSGAITGTPTAAGNSSFTVRVTDAQSPAQSATLSLSLVVNAATLVVSTSSLADGAVGVAYNVSLAATGGTAPYSWSIASGSLPAGLSINGAGVISGTPTAAGTASLTVQVNDSATPANVATRPLTLAVAAAPLTVATTALANGTAGVAYSANLTANGGVGPYSWAVVAGTLPSGISLSAGGVLSGTPAAAGSDSFTVQVVDSQTPAHNSTQTLTLNVNPAALAVATTTLPDGVVGSAYNSALSATGGVTPYTWSLVGGALPNGLSLSTTGIISGTPTGASSSSFTVRVLDNQGTPASATRSFTINIAPAPLVITTPSPLAGGQMGSGYNTTLAVSGGTGPYFWSIVGGALPAGLSLSVGGVLSGTPSAAGTSSFTVQVSDSQTPAHNTTQSYTLTVSPAPLVITTSTLSNATVGIGYNASIAASGGTVPYTWSLASGSLPAGLSLSSAGVISGTPTAPGTSSFTVQVVDSQVPSHNTSQSLTLTVNPGALSVSTNSLPNGAVGAAYTATLSASGGLAPYSWTITSGALPAGLSLGSSGQISGTATAAGTASFTVQVSDAQGSPATASKALTLAISPAALTITSSSLPNGSIGNSYNANLSASGGVAPYSWSVASGTLPAGLSLNAAGAITGTPTSAVAATIVFRVTDSQGTPATATRSLTLTTTGTASISWTAPQLNDDGSALTRGGYFIYYGKTSGSLTNSQQVPNPSAIGDVVTGLSAGTWFFSVTVYDSSNNQSIRTNEVSVIIP